MPVNPLPLLPLALMLLLGMACLTAGRLLATHSTTRPELRTPLAAFTAGLGAYTLWWLFFVPTLGAGGLVAAGLFAVSVVALSGALFRTWHSHPVESHHLPLVILQVLLLLPLVLLIINQPFSSSSAFTHAQFIRQLALFPDWPDPIRLATYALPPLSAVQPTWAAIWLPGQAFSAGGPWPALGGLLNVTLLLGAAGALLATLRVPIRWSNVLLAASGSLLVLLLAAPLGLKTLLLTPGPLLLVSVCLFTALAPLLRPEPAPVGAAALLAAFSLTAAVGLHPLGLPLALLVVGLWVARMLLEGLPSPSHAARQLFAATALFTLPLLAWLMWQHALTVAGQGWLAVLEDPAALLALLVSVTPAAPAWLALALPLLAVLASLPLLRHKPQHLPWSLRTLFTTLSAATVPTLLALAVLGLYAWLPARPLAAPAALLLWFVWLVPVWKLYLHHYQKSPLQNAAFAQPWGIGALLGLAVLALAMLYRPGFTPVPPPALARIQLVAADIATRDLVPFGEPLATYGLTPTATAAVGLGLAHRTPVAAVPVPQGPLNRAQLHGLLRRGGFQWLLANGRTPGVAEALGVPPPLPGTMLLQVTSDALLLRSAWGLPQAQDKKPVP